MLSRNRCRFSSIVEAKMLPKSVPKSFKIHSQSHPETEPQKTTKIYRTKPSQTLKIELSCTRGASFHYFTLSKNKKLKKPFKSTPQTTKKRLIEKHTKQNTLKTSTFYSKNDPKMEPKGLPWSGTFRQHRPPGPPKAPNPSKDDPRTPTSQKK